MASQSFGWVRCVPSALPVGIPPAAAVGRDVVRDYIAAWVTFRKKGAAGLQLLKKGYKRPRGVILLQGILC